MKHSEKLDRDLVKYTNILLFGTILTLILIGIFGCASYMGDPKSVTRLECEMRHEIKCNELPETLW